MTKIPENEFDSRKHVKEFKRKCNSCSKVWHVLASREKQVEKDVSGNNLQICANCCHPSAQLQAKRNVEANQTELDKLRKCPECQSANYTEEVLIYEKKN